MHQGNVGLFEHRETGKYAWFWKLWDQQSGRPVYVNLADKSVVGEKEVETTDTKDERPWRFVDEIWQCDMLRLFTFDMPEPDEYIKQKSIYEKQKDLARDQKLLKDLLDKQEQIRMASDDLYNRIQTLSQKIASRTDELRCADKDWSGFYYIHAKHHAADGQDYCWYADDDLGPTIMPGDTILVDTSRGHQLALVTWVERARDYRTHKKVIANMTEHKGVKHV